MGVVVGGKSTCVPTSAVLVIHKVRGVNGSDVRIYPFERGTDNLWLPELGAFYAMSL